jgi:hypothetical protein
MLFSHSDITAMIQAMGTTCLIGITPVTGVFSTGPREIARNGVSVYTDTPTLLLSVADAELVVKNETIITINNVDYQAFEKVADGAGFVELDLTGDF